MRSGGVVRLLRVGAIVIFVLCLSACLDERSEVKKVGYENYLTRQIFNKS
jgi:hypothetical protein